MNYIKIYSQITLMWILLLFEDIPFLFSKKTWKIRSFSLYSSKESNNYIKGGWRVGFLRGTGSKICAILIMSHVHVIF